MNMHLLMVLQRVYSSFVLLLSHVCACVWHGLAGNQSLVRELCFTARNLSAAEALAGGLVSQVFADRAALLAGTMAVAATIAQKSPIAVMGTKHNLLYSRDHSVEAGLGYVATWNMAMLQSSDFLVAVTASLQKRPAVFAKL
jgi:delta(3,5)-delta(2,4)-dienoyl-CoA isomerase